VCYSLSVLVLAFYGLPYVVMGRPLYSAAVVSSSFFFLFFSSVLSGRRLDVYRTSTHDVVLVRILNACLKCAAHGSLKIEDAKICRCIIAQLCRAVSSQLRHVSTIGKEINKQQSLLHMSSQYGELGLLMGEISWQVWGTPLNFNGFHVLSSLLH